MIKRLLVAGLALLAGAAVLPAQTVPGAVGGLYTKVADPDEGELAREGRIVVIFDGGGKVWFDANLGRADGHTAIFSQAGQTQKFIID